LAQFWEEQEKLGKARRVAYDWKSAGISGLA